MYLCIIEKVDVRLQQEKYGNNFGVRETERERTEEEKCSSTMFRPLILYV